jgi:hypothetical protein
MKGKATSVATATTSSKKSTLQPIAPTDVNPQNQQYYEFQWRVLNLCAEFYGAAEELLVSRSSVFFVVLWFAQGYC